MGDIIDKIPTDTQIVLLLPKTVIQNLPYTVQSDGIRVKKQFWCTVLIIYRYQNNI